MTEEADVTMGPLTFLGMASDHDMEGQALLLPLWTWP